MYANGAPRRVGLSFGETTMVETAGSGVKELGETSQRVAVKGAGNRQLGRAVGGRVG